MYLILSVSRRFRTQSIYDRKGAREGVLEVWSSREVHHCIGRKGERTVRYVRFDSKSGNLPTCLPRWCITWYSWHLWCNILFVTTTDWTNLVYQSEHLRPQLRTSKLRPSQTGRSRGFAFIYFESTEDAQAAKDGMCDQEIDGRRIRVDFSITKRAHTPTPGVYMGRPT